MSTPLSLPQADYLRVAEAATLLRVTPKRVRNLMSAGTLRKGTHWFSPAGLGPRFKRAALVAYIEESETVTAVPAQGRALAGLDAVDRQRRRA